MTELDYSSYSQKPYFRSLVITILLIIVLVVAFLYFFVFSRQSQIQETIARVAGVQSTQVPEAVPTELELTADTAVPKGEQPEPQFQTYVSQSAALSFQYPSSFTVKAENPDCSYCPELVLERGDERLWFGTLPPEEDIRCEKITSEQFKTVAGQQILIYTYEVPTDDEYCQSMGLETGGVKATFNSQGKAYYFDYLFISNADIPDTFESLVTSLQFLQ
jgi:hypothetical protein